MIKLAVLASGGGTNLQAIMDAADAKRLGAEVKVVVSDRPDAFALERARKRNIPTELVTKEAFPTRDAFNAELARVLKAHGVDLVVLAGFMRIVSKTVLDAFPMRVINIHPSLLPSFPGLDVQKKALEYGVKFSGCTVHFVDEGIDSGPIIIQAVVPVLDGDTVETLSKRILEEEHRIYPQAIRLISEARLEVSGRHVRIRDGAPSGASLENPGVDAPND